MDYFEVSKQFGTRINLAPNHQNKSKLKLSFRLIYACMVLCENITAFPETKRNIFLFCNKFIIFDMLPISSRMCHSFNTKALRRGLYKSY